MQESNRLEDFLTRASQPNGRAFKQHVKMAARSAADEFLRSNKTIGNRQHYRGCLMAAGVPEDIAHDIATKD